VLYTDYRYGWDTGTVGLVLAAVGVLSALVGAGVVRVVFERLGERRTLLLGLAFGACGFALYGLAPTSAIFFAGVPLVALWGLAGPAAQSLMTQQVDPSEQGRLQGAISGVQGVAFMTGPVLFTAVYAAFIGGHSGWKLPGAPFLLAAVLLGTAFALAWRVARR
jgi:MFS transporter, DHA1 family, tetracycline resistance protein